MRLKNICIALFMSLFMLTTTVAGYSTDTFSVEVNEGYETQEEEGLVMFQNKETGDNVVVQEIEQKVIGGKLTSYQLKSISSEITNQYKDLYDADVEEIGKEEVIINGRTITKMNFKTTLMGTAVYQELNIFVAADKIYDIIFTSTSENGFAEGEKQAILNSFTILNDNSSAGTEGILDSSSNIGLAWVELAVIVVIGVVLMVIGLKRNPKSKLFILAIIFFIIQGLAIDGIEMETGSTEQITADIAYNIGFFVFAIIAMILLVIPVIKRPKYIKSSQTEENAKQEEIQEPKTETGQKENINESNSSDEE